MANEEDTAFMFDEDPDEDRILAESARRGSEEAVRQTLAAGIPITILRGNEIVEIHPDGSEKVVKKV